MKRQLKQAAQSPRTLGWGLVLNMIGTGIAAVAAIWPTLRSEIPLPIWLVGLFFFGAVNVWLHRNRERAV